MCSATWRPLPHCTPLGQWGASGSAWSLCLPHPQGKEEFEKTQKELLEKGSIMRQGKGHLELQQVRGSGSPGPSLLSQSPHNHKSSKLSPYVCWTYLL